MQNFLHVHSLCLGIPFNCTALEIHLYKTSQNTVFTISKQGLLVKFAGLT